MATRPAPNGRPLEEAIEGLLAQRCPPVRVTNPETAAATTRLSLGGHRARPSQPADTGRKWGSERPEEGSDSVEARQALPHGGTPQRHNVPPLREH